MKGMIPMRISKKILACVLAALMAIAMMPFTAFAATTDVATAEALAAAITAANAGDTITLTADIEVASPVVIPAGKDVKLNINNHSLSGNIADTDGKKLIQVSGKLEFVGNGGCIYNTNVAGQGHAACQALSGGTVIVNAPVTFGDSDTDRNNANAVNRGCGIQNNGGTLVLNDGYYTAIDANYSTGAWAYAILNCEGDTTINNATVYGLALHGALGCEDGTLTVNDGTFAVNGANNYYSLYCDGGSIIVNGGSFTDNSKNGVNYMGTNSDTEINGGTFDFSATTPFVNTNSKGDLVVSGGNFEKDGAAFTVPAKYLAEGCTQDASGAVAQTYVAKVGSTYYETLEAAVEASSEGNTITLIADVHLEGKYGRSTAAYIFNLKNRTLDLNGKTISMYNHGAGFAGDNMVIKNGTFTCVPTPTNVKTSYALPIYPEEFTRQTTTSSDLETMTDKSTGVVLEDLVLNPGGLNIKGADVTCKNLDVTGSYYHGVSAEHESVVTIESGNYTTTNAGSNRVLSASDITDAKIAANKIADHTQFVVKGGNFKTTGSSPMFNTSATLDHYVVSGGTFTKADATAFVVPEKYIANGYIQDTTTGEVVANAAVDTMSITVEDNIDLNIYVADPTDEIATIDFSYNTTPNLEEENIRTKTVKAKKNADGKIALSVDLAPAQIMDAITVTAKRDNGTTVKSFETSVADYCNTIIGNNGFTAEVKNLAKSTLDYGKAANDYFQYNNQATWTTSDLANPDDAIAALATAAAPNTFNSDMMHITAATYRATSKPELRFYISEDLRQQSYLANLTLTSNIGKAEFAKTADGTAMLRIYDIDITDFNKQIVVQYKVNEFDDYSYDLIKFTPIKWVNAAIGASDPTMKALGRAIGNYYLASVAYFGE
jgi:hypothetical protein